MGLRVCPECGAWVSEHAPRCIHCGYPLGVVQPTPPVPTPAPPAEEPSANTPPTEAPASPQPPPPPPPDETENSNVSGGEEASPPPNGSEHTDGKVPDGGGSDNLAWGVVGWMLFLLIIIFVWGIAKADGNGSGDYDGIEAADSIATDSAAVDTSYYDDWAPDTTAAPADY